MSLSGDFMKQAAQTFSRILAEHGIEHAFIGGFALKMLDHQRETLDIDVEVGVSSAEELRSRVTKILCDADPRFVVSHLKLFFVPNGDWESRVPVETLARGVLNLPRRLSILRPGDGSIPILEPGVLILTKMKRSAQYIGSTRPQSVSKYNSDVRDIVHLLHWLRANEKKVDFISYDAASPQRLYDAVRKMRSHWRTTGQSTNVQLLDDALEANDKAIIVGN